MTKDNRIVVTVQGGVIQDIQFPAGYRLPVAVHDYDTDGVDESGLEYDARGDPFVEALWEPDEREERGPSVPASSDAVDIATHLSGISDTEAKSLLIEIYRWMYWDEDRGRWYPDKDISGADTVQMLCELLPNPPETGGGP